MEGRGVTLVVERYPLVSALSFDCECCGAVVAVDASCDDMVRSKGLITVISNHLYF